jgi:diguanylate cyclase (GGDEF)-like protein
LTDACIDSMGNTFMADTATKKHSGLSLIQKMAAGYAAMALFTMAALIFSSLRLYSINKAAAEIVNTDLPAISALIRLRGSLLAQESFAGKYSILKDPAFIDLFRQRSSESAGNIAVLQSTIPPGELRPVKTLYLEYQEKSQQLFSAAGTNGERLRPTALKLLQAVDALYAKRQEKLQSVLQQANRQQQSAVRWTVVISCAGFLIAMAVALFVTSRTFGAIRKLQRATHRIAEGDFDYDPQITGGDEVSELAHDFTKMAGRLKELERMSLDASPLTRLPGNFVIERVLDERLKSGTSFAFCHADLDNFKPFSDHYGYAKGSELLRATGDLIYTAVQEQGGEDGFVGHIGGDDFVMVVPTDRAASACEAVIEKFDAEVLSHFSPEEIKAGGIEGVDRYGVERFFPLTSISIAVVICDKGQFSSAVEIARAAAKVKDAAKEQPGSSYLISRHRQGI